MQFLAYDRIDGERWFLISDGGGGNHDGGGGVDGGDGGNHGGGGGDGGNHDCGVGGVRWIQPKVNSTQSEMLDVIDSIRYPLGHNYQPPALTVFELRVIDVEISSFRMSYERASPIIAIRQRLHALFPLWAEEDEIWLCWSNSAPQPLDHSQNEVLLHQLLSRMKPEYLQINIALVGDGQGDGPSDGPNGNQSSDQGDGPSDGPNGDQGGDQNDVGQTNTAAQQESLSLEELEELIRSCS